MLNVLSDKGETKGLILKRVLSRENQIESETAMPVSYQYRNLREKMKPLKVYKSREELPKTKIWLSVREAAQNLKVHQMTVRFRIMKGKLEGVKVGRLTYVGFEVAK